MSYGEKKAQTEKTPCRCLEESVYSLNENESLMAMRIEE